MITDEQFRRFMNMLNRGRSKEKSAVFAGIDVKTGNKYLNEGKYPSEMRRRHTWRTRPDPFQDVWEEVEPYLEENTGLLAKTLFVYLQRIYPGRFSDSQLRTFQRKVKIWRALNGKPREVFFDQKYNPGEYCASDFTSMKDLQITIAGEPYEHLIYHFVLPYSNWETGCICFSESFESLSHGLQNALWALKGVPIKHRTDRLSAAVNNMNNLKEFTEAYKRLLEHYKLEGRKTNPGSPNENGDVEQAHNRFKIALDQSLILRGSRDFDCEEEYQDYLNKLFDQLNSNRIKRFREELKILRPLPSSRRSACKEIPVRVTRSSTIRVNHNVYSVHSRLIGERVTVHLFSDHLDIWYARKLIERIPRLYGAKKHCIQYRHIIDWLVRKPEAFENYKYKSDLFPGSYFRMAYDILTEKNPRKSSKEYLKILYLAATENETLVANSLRYLIQNQKEIKADIVSDLIRAGQKIEPTDLGKIGDINLPSYDALLEAAYEA